MARLNKVQIIGHIGVDPQLRHTNTNNVPVVNLRVATNEGWTDKNTGQKMESTTWHTVVCYRKLAEIVAQHMSKGRQVYIEGRLQIRPYMGKATDANGNPVMLQDGTQLMVQKYAAEIIADDVQFLGKNPNAQAYPQAAGTPVYAAPVAAAPGTPVVAAAGNPNAAAATFVQAAPTTPVATPAPAAPVGTPAPANPAAVYTPVAPVAGV